MAAPKPVVGDRVVVRYRLASDAPDDWRGEVANPAFVTLPSLSDVTGVLAEVTPTALRLDQAGEPVVIPRRLVTAIRVLSGAVVRNSEIRELERALFIAANPTASTEIDGWVLNDTAVGDAGALRGSLCAPLGFGANAAALPAVIQWYREREHTARALLPDRLVRPGSIPVPDAGIAVEVLVSAEAVPDLPAVSISSDRWALTIPATDQQTRKRARAAGMTLHHSGRVHTL